MVSLKMKRMNEYRISLPYFDFLGLPVAMLVEANKYGCDFLKQA